MFFLKVSSKWFKIRCSFAFKFQNPKMALCGVLIGKLILHYDIIDFSWFHIILTIKDSLKRCIIVFSCNLQKEHRGKITFPNLKSILFTYKVLCKTLYWNIRAFVSKVVFRIRKYIFFPIKIGWFEKILKIILCCWFNRICINKNYI